MVFPAMLTRLGRPSLSSTQLGWTGSRSWKELTCLLAQTDRTPLLTILTIVNQHPHQYNKLLLLTTSTTTTTTTSTTTMSSLHKLPTLTGTHSSTPTTPPTETSSTTPMPPSSPLATLTPNRSPVSPHVLTVEEATPSSTHTTLLTRAGMSHQPNQYRRLPQQHTTSTTTTTSTTLLLIQHSHQRDFSHQENSL